MYRDVGGKSRRLLRRKLLREYVISLHLYLLAILFLGRYILQRPRVSFKVGKEGKGRVRIAQAEALAAQVHEVAWNTSGAPVECSIDEDSEEVVLGETVVRLADMVMVLKDCDILLCLKLHDCNEYMPVDSDIDIHMAEQY